MIKIPVANVSLGEEEAIAVANVVKSGRLSMGPKVADFEKDFCTYTGAQHAIALNNGTAALHVALAALNLKPEDEVILPSLTFISTAYAVMYLGATPVLCECDPLTYNVTVDNLQECLTNKTRAIIPVEMNGMPINYDDILNFAEDNNLKVVIDSAESLGSSYKNNKIGSIAPVHMFSFFPNKIITTGEGGMITTNSDSLAKEMRILLNQGQDYRYNHIRLGYNYRMTELQAAIGIQQLQRIEYRIQEKNRIAEFYNNAFCKMDGISIPYVPDYITQHSWYMYSVRVDPFIRDAVVKHLENEGIETRLSFPPVHTQPFIQKTLGYTADLLPHTNQAWNSKIDIPAWPGIIETDLDKVVNAMQSALDKESQ